MGLWETKLEHRNIVSIRDHGEDEGHYYVMEYIDGVDLGGALREGPLEPALVTYLGVELCRAFVFMHHGDPSRGRPKPVIHSDVTPDNILLGRDGSVKLSDFGLAKALGRTGADTITRARGKVRWMAPEQLRGDDDDGEVTLNARTDLFALGLVLWFALIGSHPYAEGRARQRPRPARATRLERATHSLRQLGCPRPAPRRIRVRRARRARSAPRAFLPPRKDPVPERGASVKGFCGRLPRIVLGAGAAVHGCTGRSKRWIVRDIAFALPYGRCMSQAAIRWGACRSVEREAAQRARWLRCLEGVREAAEHALTVSRLDPEAVARGQAKRCRTLALEQARTDGERSVFAEVVARVDEVLDAWRSFDDLERDSLGRYALAALDELRRWVASERMDALAATKASLGEEQLHAFGRLEALREADFWCLAALKKLRLGKLRSIPFTEGVSR